MKNRLNKETIIYSLIQAIYWMNFCVAGAFTINYLLGIGFSNSLAGAFASSASIIAMFAAPNLASKMDQDIRYSAYRLFPVVLIVQIASIVLSLFIKNRYVLGILFVIYLSLVIISSSINLKIYSDASHQKLNIDYSFARGMGSLSFALFSSVLGILIDLYSVKVMLYVGILLSLLQGIAFVLMEAKIDKEKLQTDHNQERSLLSFLKDNKAFTLLIIGASLLFFSHSFITTFMINIMRNVGGDTRTMGFGSSFMACMELPVMLLYGKLFSHLDQKKILSISFICFSFKALAFALAKNVGSVFGAMIFQAPSFALFTSAIVPYVDKTVAYEDTAKAQSLAFTTTTIGGVLSGMIGGVLLDSIGVTGTLLISFAVSLIGTAICLYAVNHRVQK